MDITLKKVGRIFAWTMAITFTVMTAVSLAIVVSGWMQHAICGFSMAVIGAPCN